MGISVWQLLIILAIVLVLFGAKKLRNIGGDLGSAIKNFKQSVKEGDEAEEEQVANKDKAIESGRVINANAEEVIVKPEETSVKEKNPA